MKKLLALLVFLPWLVQGATLQSVNSTNELVLLSPYTISTNTFVVTESVIGDTTAAIWTFIKGDTNGPDSTHLDSIVSPGAGRWVKNMTGGGVTNLSLLIVTNLTVVSNLYAGDIYATNIITTNLYILNTNYFNPTQFTMEFPEVTVDQSVTLTNKYIHGFIYATNKLWGVSYDTPDYLLRFNDTNDLTDYDVLTFPRNAFYGGAGTNDHYGALDVVYAPSTDRLYVVHANTLFDSKCLISSVNPSTLAFTDVVHDSEPYVFQSLATDDTNLFAIGYGTTNSIAHKWDLATFTRSDLILDRNFGHAIRWDGTNIYATLGTTNPMIVKIDPVAFTLTLTNDFTSAYQRPTDDFCFVGDYIWVGLEDTPGYILKIAKSDLSITAIPTGMPEGSYATYYDGTYVWSAIKSSPGKLLRIDPTTHAMAPFTLTLNQPNEIYANGTNIWVTYWGIPASIQKLTPNAFGNFVSIKDTALTTNLWSYTTLTAGGAFVTTNLTVATVNAGTNVLTTTNASMFVLASTATSNVVVQLNKGFSGQHIWIANYWTNAAFSMFTSPTADDPAKYTWLRGNEWTPTEAGETIELLGVPGGWVEIGRSNPNGPAPLSVTFNPTDNYVPYRVNSNTLGDSWFAVDGDDMDFNGTNVLHYINIQNSTNLLSLGIAGAGALVQGGNVLNLLNNDAKGLSISTNYVNPSNDGALSLGGAGAQWNSFYLTNQIVWGPGTTNVLYRDTIGLTYTNGAAQPFIQLKKGDGTGVKLQMSTGSHALLMAGIGSDLYLSANNNGSGDVLVTGAAFTPVAKTTDLGGLSSPWKSIYLTNAISTANANPIRLQMDGTNVFRIDYENWVDSMVPAASVKTGVNTPTFTAFAGSPVLVYMFNNNQDDEVYFSCQLNHNYKQGTDISPHVHFAETVATGAGTNVVWELVSGWANVNAQFSAWATNYVTNSITGTTNYHQLGEFTHLTGTSKTVSSVLTCRLRRMASSATADDYDQDVAFLGFDFHYQVDSPGSDAEGSKSF